MDERNILSLEDRSFSFVLRVFHFGFSIKQPALSRFSAEAEYKALAFTTFELLLLSYLLRDLAVPFRYQFLRLCSNASLTHLAANPVFHARSKHIEVDYHFVRDLSQTVRFTIIIIE